MLNKLLSNTFLSFLLTLLFAQSTLAQSSNNTNNLGQQLDKENTDRLNTITTAVPFLLISPDSRAGAMGDIGGATTPDVNSIHWNPSKLAFAENNMGFGISYTPWLRHLVNDINLSYLSFYKKVDDRSAFGASMRYFSLGSIQFTDEFGNNTRQFRPNEFAFDLAYATKLADRFSGGIALRYIYSNLTGGVPVQGADTEPGQSIAADVSGYYVNDEIRLGEKDGAYAIGMNISNIGAKISYSNTARRDFIPINMRLGQRLTIDLDKYNSLSFMVDINKLLVPTPPIYKIDSAGQPIVVGDGFLIGAGSDPNRAVANGMFGSFTDSPGNPIRDEDGNFLENPDGTYQVEKGSVLKEELRELNICVGVEYWYDKQFAVRAGYFWEHELKGNRKFMTVGAGLKYNVFGIDFSYLFPLYINSSNFVQSPLQNTVRFTLTFDFDAFRKQSSEIPTN